MRIRDIGKNLLDYNMSFEEATIEGRAYRFSPSFADKAPEILTGQAFGSSDDYNKILAQSILDAQKFFGVENAPVYVQKEIGKFLEEGVDSDNLHQFGITYDEGESSVVLSKYDTSDFFRDASKGIELENASHKNLAFFAHPAHVYRVMEIGKKFGLEGGVFLPKEVTWPSEDPQPWVRGEKPWVPRELLARAHHWALGYVPRN